jgi:hypothetical protein
LLFIVAQGSLSAEQHLRGCQDPAVIGEALKSLQQNNWKKLSAQRVLSVWPSRFDELKCESGAGCRILVSKERVISGHCECCESFVFTVEMNQDGSEGEHLSDIIVHYSDPDKNFVIDAAKQMVEGAGLPKDQVGSIGRRPIQRFYWDDERSAVRQSYTLELHLSRVGQQWELYMYILADQL